MSGREVDPGATRAQLALAGTIACKVGVQLGVAVRVATGSLERVGYQSVVFQSLVYFAIWLAVRRGGRLAAAIGMAFVGYDLVLSVLDNTIGWRLVVKIVTSVVLIAVLALVALSKREKPDLASLTRSALMGLVVGGLLSLVFVSPIPNPAPSRSNSKAPVRTEVDRDIPTSAQGALSTYFGIDSASELDCASAGLSREFSAEELEALDGSEPDPPMIARISKSVAGCAE